MQPITLGDGISGPGLGFIGEQNLSSGGGNALAQIVSSVIGFMTIAAGIWFIFMFLIGGYTWMTSMGDKHRLEEARDRIVYALVGLVIVVAAWGITSLAGSFFGIDFLDPATLINNIRNNN